MIEQTWKTDSNKDTLIIILEAATGRRKIRQAKHSFAKALNTQKGTASMLSIKNPSSKLLSKEKIERSFAHSFKRRSWKIFVVFFSFGVPERPEILLIWKKMMNSSVKAKSSFITSLRERSIGKARPIQTSLTAKSTRF